MAKHIVIASLAGIASGTFAQTASLSIVASQSVVDITMTTAITLSVYADADFGTHITGAAFTLNALGDNGTITYVESNGAAAWGALGEDDFGDGGQGNHNGLVMGQVVFLPYIQPDVASALGHGPVFLASFTVGIRSGVGSIIDWSVGGGIGTFALEVIDVNGNPGGNPPGVVTQVADPVFRSTRVYMFPAPSSGALLGLSVLVANRRRR